LKPSSDLRALVLTHPRVALLLLQILASRLRDADRKWAEFGVLDTVGRVARRLVELAQDYGSPPEGGVRIDVRYPSRSLGGWNGASRESVSKALHTLRTRGCIETRRKGIIVLDMPALRRRAN
jgi:CRP-like cAMP-binding protein